MTTAYVASWTDGVHGAGSKGGVRSFAYDDATGSLSLLAGYSDRVNAGFLALSPRHRTLYLADERKDLLMGGGGGVLSFEIGEAGVLIERSRVSSVGPNPSYLDVNPSGTALVSANHGNTYHGAVRIDQRSGESSVIYDDGTVTLFPIGEDGLAGPACDVHVVEPPSAGVDPVHQRSAHPHSARFDPTGRFVLCCDKGSDRVHVFEVGDPELTLRPVGQLRCRQGIGPRHFGFHPCLRVIYVLNELESSLDVYSWDESNRTLEPIQTIATMSGEAARANHPGDMALDSTGAHIYVTNRDPGSIVAYRIDGSDGTVEQVDAIASGGNRPRGLAVAPGDRHLVVANTESHCVATFEIDVDSGGLLDRGVRAEVNRPTCVRFWD